MEQNLKENLGHKGTWIRLVFMILFAVAFNVTEAVIVAIVVFQFLCKLVTGDANERLREFGHNIGLYLGEIVAYLTYHTEEKPFPFAAWPSGGKSTPAKPKRAKGRAKIEATPKPPEPGPGPSPDDATEGTA